MPPGPSVVPLDDPVPDDEVVVPLSPLLDDVVFAPDDPDEDDAAPLPPSGDAVFKSAQAATRTSTPKQVRRAGARFTGVGIAHGSTPRKARDAP